MTEEAGGVNIAEVRPVWVRVLMLILIGIPPLSGWDYLDFEGIDRGMTRIIAWGGFALFVWLFIVLNMGIERLSRFLAGSFVLALTTALIGASMRRLVPVLAGGATSEEISRKMALLFVIMIATIPYALLVVNSFSASSLAKRVSALGGRRRVAGVHGALALRVLQHVGETFAELFVVWREENPDRLLPRYRADWRRSPLSWFNFVNWFLGATVVWCLACLLHTFEALPLFVNEFARLEHDPISSNT